MLDKTRKQEIIRSFGIHEQDTGSVPVSIALLTEEITVLTEHCKIYRKDYSSRRGLIMKVSQRKSLLKYLKRKNSKQHADVVARLELRT